MLLKLLVLRFVNMGMKIELLEYQIKRLKDIIENLTKELYIKDNLNYYALVCNDYMIVYKSVKGSDDFENSMNKCLDIFNENKKIEGNIFVNDDLDNIMKDNGFEVINVKLYNLNCKSGD